MKINHDAEDFARLLFQAFQKYQGHYYNMEACRDVAKQLTQEVVQDEIEVGDEVGRGGQGGLVVVAVDMNPAAEACVRYMDGSLDVHEISSLTLIRKGPKKHVTEMKSVEQAFVEGIECLNTALKMEGLDG